MESEEIRTLLASIPRRRRSRSRSRRTCRRSRPPAVVAAGGDPALIEKWVRAVKGWPKRIPPMFAAPDATELELMFFIVPDRELEAGRQAAGPRSRDADLIAFVPTKDMAKARPFYEQTLGLKLEGSSPLACAFRANGVLLRLIAVEQLTPHPFTVLGWSVEDIATTVAGLTASGVVVRAHRGRRAGRARRLAVAGRRERGVVQGPRRQHAVAHSVLSLRYPRPHERRRDPQAAVQPPHGAIHLVCAGDGHHHGGEGRRGRRRSGRRRRLGRGPRRRPRSHPAGRRHAPRRDRGPQAQGQALLRRPGEGTGPPTRYDARPHRGSADARQAVGPRRE